MHNEDEAKKLWCPFSRTVSANIDDKGKIAIEPGAIARNRVALTEDISLMQSACIASGCMMWRWSKRAVPEKGYCGLAGRPFAL